MGRFKPLERALVAFGSAVILAVPAFIVLTELSRVPQAARHPAPPDPAPAGPPPERTVRARGRVVDVPGFRVSPGILGRTRVVLMAGGAPVGEPAVPESDGTFVLEGKTALEGLTLRVSTGLELDRFDRSLDRVVFRDLPLTSPQAGDVPLPRSDEFGSIAYRVVDAAGLPLSPAWVGLEAVEGTLTPDVGIARLDDLAGTANAPCEYRRGAEGTILHVPPGEYRLMAFVPERLVTPVLLRVAAREAAVARPAERSSPLRIRGVVRDAGFKRPLEDVEVAVGTEGHAGTTLLDPARVLMRTSGSGAYALPLLDPPPPGGLRVSFTCPGYRRSDLLLKPGQLRGGDALVVDVDLGRP